MTRVKICGITTAEDARAALDAGADALGFVFADSARRISPRRAARIVAALPANAATVGVFLDASAEEIGRVLREVPLERVQLHGNETPALCRRVTRPVLKRVAVRPGDCAASLAGRVRRFPETEILLDPGRGDGAPFRWELARALRRPFWLAGGLRPDNVALAIEVARPAWVDVSSGVELSPGRKDARCMRAFVGAVRRSDARAFA